MDLSVHYAQSGDVSIAYRVLGDAPLDLVLVPGYISHLDVGGENPRLVHLTQRFMGFARMILFDKRGTGMSDPVVNAPTLEERMDDLRAVMDAAGCERAAIMGASEGAPMSILFAATYPERVRTLVLTGAMAKTTWAPDYPWAPTREAMLESLNEFILPRWGEGDSVDYFAPSMADDPVQRAWWAKIERSGASPGMMRRLAEMFFQVDVRDVLPLIQVPTLVLHHKGDRVVRIEAARDLAEHIAGARLVELPGIDHVTFGDDAEQTLDVIQEFLTGTKPVAPEEFERVLATVMFTDLVGSTERAAAAGDRRWRDTLEQHHAAVRRDLERFRGREVKTMGDGFLATFDGPARAIRCARTLIDDTRELGLEMRVGLHTGEVELMGEDIGGLAVHIAARIGAQATAGEVLVSSTVRDLVAGSGITFQDHGAAALKGVPGEWQLLAVSSA